MAPMLVPEMTAGCIPSSSRACQKSDVADALGPPAAQGYADAGLLPLLISSENKFKNIHVCEQGLCRELQNVKPPRRKVRKQPGLEHFTSVPLVHFTGKNISELPHTPGQLIPGQQHPPL